jgi:putative membrane-bound dehydrogenase-like protein
MRGYSESGAEKLGRVRRLSDGDRDGCFERSEIMVEGLRNPTAICCARGGVIVGDAPELLFFADRNGDGVSDERHVLFTGFGAANIQQLLNNLMWGLDGRLYGASGGNGGEVGRGDQPWPFPLAEGLAVDKSSENLRGRDFVIDLRRGTLEATTGGGQFGQTMDDWGNRYVCSNSDHCQQIVLEDRYLARNPWLRSGIARVSIAEDGPAATIFRASPVEAWRVARTEMRIQGRAKGPIEGGGRASGYFSGATGICFYDGTALPKEYQGNLFVADAGSNLVHRKQLLARGVVNAASRVEQGREFLASTDNWFRPVQLVNAPDGALWVLDMYREVVEHPASLPEPIKRQLDLSSGNDRGRLYRIVRRGEQVPTVRLPGEATSLEELVSFLGHANGWHRRTAARLLRERGGAETIAIVQKWVAAQPLDEQRVRGWYLLRDWGALSVDELLVGLRGELPGVRVHALRLAEGIDDARLQMERCRLAHDPDERVRFRAALSLGEFPSPEGVEALAHVASSAGESDWLRLAVLCSADTRRPELLEKFLAGLSGRLGPTELEFSAELAGQIGRAGSEAEERQLASLISRIVDAQPAVATACWLAATAGDGARVQRFDDYCRGDVGAGKALSVQLVDHARQVVRDTRLSATERATSTGMLDSLPVAELLPLWRELIDVSQPELVRAAAVELCSRVARPDFTGALLERLRELTPELRTRALGGLLAREDSLGLLLTALESGEVPSVFLSSSQRQQLLSHSVADVRQRAEKLYGAAAGAVAAERLAAYRDTLANLSGEPEAGRAVFLRVCAGCHRLAGEGHEVGPNLIGYAFRSRDDLLSQVLEPNREVDPRYLAYSVELRDGRLLLGVLAGENANAVILRTATGESVTLNREEIEAIRSTSKSLMPENLENELSPQQAADLFAWVQSLRQ